MSNLPGSVHHGYFDVSQMLPSRRLVADGVPPEVFKTNDVKKVLCNKFLVIIGHSGKCTFLV